MSDPFTSHLDDDEFLVIPQESMPGGDCPSTCGLCLRSRANVVCEECDGLCMCFLCDMKRHQPSQRHYHVRATLDDFSLAESTSSSSCSNVEFFSLSSNESSFIPSIWRIESPVVSEQTTPLSVPLSSTTGETAVIYDGEDDPTSWLCPDCSIQNTAVSLSCSGCDRSKPVIEPDPSVDSLPQDVVNDISSLELVEKCKVCESLGYSTKQSHVAIMLSQKRGIRPSSFANFCNLQLEEILSEMAVSLSSLLTLSIDPGSPSFQSSTLKILPEELEDALIASESGDLDRVLEIAASRRLKVVNSIVDKCNQAFTTSDVHTAISSCDSIDIDDVITQLNLTSYDVINQYCAQQVSPTQLLNVDRCKDVESLKRIFLVEFDGLDTPELASICAELVSDPDLNDQPLDSIIQSAMDCRCTSNAKAFLKCECSMCYGSYAKDKMEQLMYCGCEMCNGCFVTWLTVAINEKSPAKWTCPLCENEDVLEEHLNYLALTVDSRPQLAHLKRRMHENMTQWSLIKNPLFRWCAHGCGNGFITDGLAIKVQCMTCSKYTCRNCKKIWEKEHETLSCDEFEQMKILNDPEKALQEIGIVCPKCNCRYEVARGGCLHFTCRGMCTYEFCSGCREAFSKGQKCSRGVQCASLGLHCHHPRNCLSYLQDLKVSELEGLLTKSSISFDRPTVNKTDCPVQITKELVSGKYIDDTCNRAVLKGDLCQEHYKEYLASKINENHLETASLFNTNLLLHMAKTNGLEGLPVLAGRETEDQFRSRVIQFIQTKLPLPKLR